MTNLRPNKIEDIIGQEHIKEQLNIAIKSAQLRDAEIPHILFYGPKGTGKTTMALSIANTAERPIQIVNAGNIRVWKDMLNYIMNIEKHSIVFIDEIHRIPKAVEEYLYTLLEDFRVELIGEDESVSIDIPQFTMLGATTEAGSISGPLFDRFVYKMPLELYNSKDLARIIKGSCKKLNFDVSSSATLNLARRARGTPRIANNFVIWLRDYCSVRNIRYIDDSIVNKAMKIIEVDKDGFTADDRKYLDLLKQMNKPID